METGNLHDTSIDHSPGSFKASIILYVCAWIFAWFETLSADVIWTWVWRTLSAISLILIIYINWNKALEIFRGKKEKTK
jgi:hypothetical protein